MGILNFGGFETGDATECRSITGGTSFSTSVKRTGTYSYTCNPATTGTNNVRIGIPGTNGQPTAEISVATLYSRFYIYITTLPASLSEEIASVIDTAGAAKAQLHITSGGKLAFYDSAAALVSTGATTLSTGTWYRIEMQTATSASAAAWEVRLNGATEMSSALSSTATQGSTNHGSLRLGKATNRNSQAYTVNFDDWMMRDDTWCGGSECKILLPAANGSSAEWTGGINSSNYLEVDEVPTDGVTTYIQKSAASDQTHYVTFQSTSTGGISGTVNAVKLHIRAMEVGTVTSSVRARLNSAGTAVEHTGFNASTTITSHEIVRTTNPATSAAWTLSAVDALEGGVRCSAATNAVRCSTVYLMVDFNASNSFAITKQDVALASYAVSAIVSESIEAAVIDTHDGSIVWKSQKPKRNKKKKKKLERTQEKAPSINEVIQFAEREDFAGLREALSELDNGFQLSLLQAALEELERQEASRLAKLREKESRAKVLTEVERLHAEYLRVEQEHREAKSMLDHMLSVAKEIEHAQNLEDEALYMEALISALSEKKKAKPKPKRFKVKDPSGEMEIFVEKIPKREPKKPYGIRIIGPYSTKEVSLNFEDLDNE